MKILIYLIIPIVLLTGCDLDNFETLSELNPPYPLVLNSSNGNIYADFLALNNEYYFSGYNVFLGSTENEVTSMQYPLSNSYGSLPYYVKSSFSVNTEFKLTLTNDYNKASFVDGVVWYVGVTAYDYQHDTNSIMAEVRSIEITN